MEITPTALKALAAVIETGSFADAGRALGYTGSAVSQQIARLEESLNITLFERQARSVKATISALYLYEQSEKLLNELATLRHEAKRLAAGQAGRLRIGTFSSASDRLLSPAIAQFLLERQDVYVSYTEGEPYELIPQVLDGAIDIALVFTYDGVPERWPEQLTLHPLHSESLHVVASPSRAIAVRKPIAFEDLSRERWITNTESTAAYQCLQGLTSRHGFQPQIAFRSNNFDAVRGLVRSSLGIALLPHLAFPDDGKLRMVRISDPLPKRRIVAVTRSTAGNGPLVPAFLERLRSIAEGLRAPEM
ncbi:LysR family transcriptional regulator [Leucobacter sp. GX24907]